MTSIYKVHKEDVLEGVLAGLCLFAITVMIFSPARFSNAALGGAKVFATKILPASLPFFFLTNILIRLNLFEKTAKKCTPLAKKLFNISGCGAFIFIAGILCGYPTGAKLTADYYQNNKISRAEAHRITTLVSTSGPLFIISTIGVGFMFNIKVGFIVFAAHIFGAIINGFIYRNYGKIDNHSITASQKKSPAQKRVRDSLLFDSAQNALSAILIIGVYIILFFLFIEIFLSLFHFKSGFMLSLTAGLIEITRGSLEVAAHIGSIRVATLLLTFIISFGGLSVHLQSLAFLNKCGITYRFFFLQKLTHAILSTIIACCLVFLL